MTRKTSSRDSIDKQCLRLCDAMNRVPGIKTTSSCCGHGEHPYLICFSIESLKALPQLLYWFDACHCGFTGWKAIVTTDCLYSPVTFSVEGPVGDEAYRQSEAIADLLEADLDRKVRRVTGSLNVQPAR